MDFSFFNILNLIKKKEEKAEKKKMLFSGRRCARGASHCVSCVSLMTPVKVVFLFLPFHSIPSRPQNFKRRRGEDVDVPFPSFFHCSFNACCPRADRCSESPLSEAHTMFKRDIQRRIKGESCRGLTDKSGLTHTHEYADAHITHTHTHT